MQFLTPRFLFRLIPALGCLALLALFIHLGQWQASKAELGAARLALFEARSKAPPLRIGTQLVVPASLAYAHVAVRGEYDAAAQFYVDNQVENGRPGVHVITPLKIEGGNTRILVNRGWSAWPDRQMPPRVKVPAGPVEISGIAVVPESRKYLLMPDRQEAWRELWPLLDLKRYSGESAHPVQPVVLHLASPAEGDELARIRPRPEDKVAMHKGYALQWFGMAAALLGFCAFAAYRKMARKRAPQA